MQTDGEQEEGRELCLKVAGRNSFVFSLSLSIYQTGCERTKLRGTKKFSTEVRFSKNIQNQNIVRQIKFNRCVRKEEREETSKRSLS